MKKITFLFMMLFVAGMISAQENEGFSTEAGRNTTFVKNGFWDNWFIGAGAGANIYFGDTDAEADLIDRVTVIPSIQVGTWLKPYAGIRLKVSGGPNLHTFSDDAATMTRTRYIAGQVDFMWNMTDYLLSYNAKRVYKFIPYVGMGFAYGWDYENTPANFKGYDDIPSATLNAGIINRFRLGDKLDLDIEFAGTLLRGDFDQRVTRNAKPYDGMASVSASLVYNIGKNTFSQAVLRDQSEIDRLNSTINSQRAEIDALKARPSTPEVVEVVKEVTVIPPGLEPVNNVVLFAIGKSKVEPHQEVNVYNVAKYLKDNKDVKVRIVGYTDNATGTPAINEKLSKERAQNVANLILNKYGIESNRVHIQWEGQTNPPFSVDEWNRAVILYIEESK